MTWRRLMAGLTACALGILAAQALTRPAGAEQTTDTGVPLPATSATGDGPPPAQVGPPSQAGGPPPAPTGEQFSPAHPLQAIPGLQAQLRAAQAALDADSAAQARAREQLGTDLEAQAQQASLLATLRDRQYRAALQLVQARTRMRTLAIEDFVSGGYSEQELNAILSSGTVQQLGQRQAIVQALSTNLADAEASLRQAERQAEGAAGPVANALARASSAVDSDQQALQAASAAVAADTQAVARATTQLQLATLAAPAPGSDIPRIVLEAYQHAAETFALIDPSCQISWADLAAIGRIESGHAQHAGTRIAANGDTYPPILGPPLDGSNGNAALLQPPNLPYYDGPGPWERAVGPMQFLPTTWASTGMVGGSDAVPNPNNVFDAAMSAANYLCRAAAGGSLTNLSVLSQAYDAYNHSASYVSEALANAAYYGATIVPPPPGA